MIADDDGGFIDVEPHIFMPGIQIAIAVLFQGEIDCGVGDFLVVN
jgi:hypothetical protein